MVADSLVAGIPTCTDLPPDTEVLVVDSVLLAALAADRQVSRIAAPQDWQERFRSVLVSVGWVLGAAGDEPVSGTQLGTGPATIDPLGAAVTGLLDGGSDPALADSARSVVTGLVRRADPTWRQRTVADGRSAATLATAGVVGGGPSLVLATVTAAGSAPLTGFPTVALTGPGLTVSVAHTAFVGGPTLTGNAEVIATKVARFRPTQVRSLDTP